MAFLFFGIRQVLYSIPQPTFGYNQLANWRGTRVVQWRGLQNLRFAGSNPARASYEKHNPIPHPFTRDLRL